MEYDASRKRLIVLGCMGLMGFMGFSYFLTGQVGHLGWFSYFGLFSYLIVARVATDLPDERYRENLRRTGNAMYPVCLWGIFCILLTLCAFSAPVIAWVLTLAGFFVLCNILYALVFRHYELKG